MTDQTDATMDTVFNILRPKGALTAEVIEALRRMFDGRLAAEIGNLKPYQLTGEIVTRGEANDFPSAADPADVSRELLQFMQEQGFVDATPAGRPAAQGPITVTMPTRLEDMDLEGLLTELNKQPSKAATIIPLIEKLDVVRKAAGRTPKWAVANPGQNGGVDVAATVSRVGALNNMFTAILEKTRDGRRYTTLHQIFGLEQAGYLNPFAFQQDDPEQYIVWGPFFEMSGVWYDMADLPQQRRRAYIWAAATKRTEWPAQVDYYRDLPEAFAPELKGRWAKIVEDYEAAVAEGDLSTNIPDRYTEEQIKTLAGQLGKLGQPARDDAWYRKQLYAVAEPVQSINGDIRRGSRDIVSTATTVSGDVSFNETILLGTARTVNGDTRGTAFGSPDCGQSVVNGDQNLRIRRMTWKQLYDLAHERDLV